MIQQISLAISTYNIALAGESLATTQYDQVQHYITLFFIFALLAYLFSSCAIFAQAKLKNNMWYNYIIDVFKKLDCNQTISCKENRQKTITWLTGEAPLVFDEISHYAPEIFSIYSNVVFTLFVFGLTLGLKLTLIIGSSLFFSVLLVSILKNKIHHLADKIQNSRLAVFTKIPFLWDNHFFGNSNLKKITLESFDISSTEYFKKTERYVILEQCLACLPIYFTVPLIIGFLTKNASYAALGAFVAVLPRSLQLLGNVHSLSIYNGRFILILRKYSNLKNFIQNLKQQDFKNQIKSNNVEIYNIDKIDTKISVPNFIENIINKSWSSGRFLMLGENGSGKTSLLKLIKSKFPEAILISAAISPGNVIYTESTGQEQMKKIEEMFSENAEIYLLDEWDANLDSQNQKIIDQKINNIKNRAIVIEVRHKIKEKME